MIKRGTIGAAIVAAFVIGLVVALSLSGGDESTDAVAQLSENSAPMLNQTSASQSSSAAALSGNIVVPPTSGTDAQQLNKEAVDAWLIPTSARVEQTWTEGFGTFRVGEDIGISLSEVNHSVAVASVSVIVQILGECAGAADWCLGGNALALKDDASIAARSAIHDILVINSWASRLYTLEVQSDTKASLVYTMEGSERVISHIPVIVTVTYSLPQPATTDRGFRIMIAPDDPENAKTLVYRALVDVSGTNTRVVGLQLF